MKLCLQNSRSYLDPKAVLSIHTSFGQMRFLPLPTNLALILRLRSSQTVSYCKYSRRFCACNESQCENPSENVNEPGPKRAHVAL